MKIFPLLSLVAGIVCCFSGTLVLSRGKQNNQNRAFFLATVLTGIWTLFPFLTSFPQNDYYATLITRLIYIFAAFVPTAWFYFMIKFLDAEEEKKKLFVFYLCSLFFGAVSFTPYLIRGIVRFSPSSYPKAGPLYLLFILYFAVVFASVLLRLIREIPSSKGHRRSQLVYITWAYLLGAISGVIHFASSYINKELIPHDIFIIIYPSILTYAIIRYRLMDIRLTITRTGIFIAVYTLVLGLPFLLAVFGKAWLGSFLGERWWLGPLILIALLATAGPFLYIYLQKRAEAILLREQRRYQETLRQSATGMTRIRNPQKLLDMIIDILTENVSIMHAGIYLLDQKSGDFILKARRNLKNNQPSVIHGNNPLINWLYSFKAPIIYDEIKRQEIGMGELIHSLDASVVVPSFLEDKLIGLIILGEKRSGRMYTSEDLNIFSVLASQSALAIENALLYENIEEQVRQRTKELVEMQKQLIQAEKLASVGTLAGGVAHEINNPLTAILTNVQMLLDQQGDNGDTGFDKESLQLIEEATKRCRTIVQKLMAYAKKPLETSEKSRVNLSDVIKNVVSFLGFQLGQDNVKLSFASKGDDCSALGNHNELEQVVTNIVLNAKDAIKKTKENGNIWIALLKSDGLVKVEIRDDGEGISKDIMTKIFDPFFTTKDVGKGLGLGLSICQAIIEKHSGIIRVKSDPGKGSVFTIELPALQNR